nr:hypothetical protein Iba_chr10eCG13420 [Ipomoea batatas]
MKNDAHLKVLYDDNGIESLALVDNSLTHKHVSDMHEILCDDEEINVDTSLLELNDVEFVTFLDTCLDNALYIHDFFGEDKEEMEGDLRDVLLTKEKEGEKENVAPAPLSQHFSIAPLPQQCSFACSPPGVDLEDLNSISAALYNPKQRTGTVSLSSSTGGVLLRLLEPVFSATSVCPVSITCLCWIV